MGLGEDLSDLSGQSMMHALEVREAASENRGQNAHNIAGVMKRKEKIILNGFRDISYTVYMHIYFGPTFLKYGPLRNALARLFGVCPHIHEVF
jgi:hypothetical protein